MTAATAYSVLGAHGIEHPLEGEWFDGIDAVVRLADGGMVVFGMRTAGYVATHGRNRTEWGGYRPLPVTLDLGTVTYWDFNAVLWLGPDPRPCLAWSNADALDHRCVATSLCAPGAAKLLAGHDGRGLPQPHDVGITLPPDVRWRAIAAPAVAG